MEQQYNNRQMTNPNFIYIQFKNKSVCATFVELNVR